MKSPHSHFILLALLSLLLSPLAVARASPAPADSVYFCLLPFDYEQGQRDHIRPAAKRLSDCALCDLFDSFNDQQEEEEEETTEEEEEEETTEEEEEDETPEEEEEMDSTSSEGGPDLIVQSPSVSAVMLTPGQEFTLNVTVHNQGDEQAAATMLHYYRSNNATITSSDTEVGTDAVDALAASATSAASIELTAPTGVSAEVGIYYGACVASVSDESNTDNNCSLAVRITVSGQVATEDDDGSEEEESQEEEELESSEDFLIREPPQAVRETFELTSFYQQWIDVEGYPVLASENVNPYAVKEAAWLIRQLMSHRPDVLQAMVQNKASLSVMAYNEMTTQIPEHSHLRPSFFWDRRARGLAGSISSCGEENVLNYPGDPYDGYNVLIHEFSHSVHLDGLNTVDPGFDDRLRKAFDAAIAKGLWKGTYASSNRREYWAEGVQAWFHAQFEFIDIDTRAELKDYDPELAKLIAEVFGDTDWRYTPATTRTHLPHLQGFDPQDSPTFEWPPELVACYQQLFEPDGDGGDKWMNLDPYNPSQLSRLRSPSNKTGETEIIFVNESGAAIAYYWIDPDGTEIYHSYLAFGEIAVSTSVGQIWLIKDQHGNDLAVFRAEEKTGRAFIGPVQAKLVAMDQDRLGLLDVPQLQQNAPNPFNSQTVLSYFLPAAGPARVEVFALTGQRVAVLHQGPQSAGHHRLHWNGLDAEGRPLASGIYLYRLATDFGVLTRKLMLLR